MAKEVEYGYVIIEFPDNFSSHLVDVFHDEFDIACRKWKVNCIDNESKRDIMLHSFTQLSRKVKDITYSDFSLDSAGVRVRIVKDVVHSDNSDSIEDSNNTVGTDNNAEHSAISLLHDLPLSNGPENYNTVVRLKNGAILSDKDNETLSIVTTNPQDSSNDMSFSVWGDDKEVPHSSLAIQGINTALLEETFQKPRRGRKNKSTQSHVIYLSEDTIFPHGAEDITLLFNVTQGYTVVDVPTRKTIQMDEFYDFFLSNIEKWLRTAVFYGVGSFS